MSSPVNQHCANCIGTLSFPIHFPLLSILFFVLSVSSISLSSPFFSLHRIAKTTLLCNFQWRI